MRPALRAGRDLFTAKLEKQVDPGKLRETVRHRHRAAAIGTSAAADVEPARDDIAEPGCLRTCRCRSIAASYMAVVAAVGDAAPGDVRGPVALLLPDIWCVFWALPQLRQSVDFASGRTCQTNVSRSSTARALVDAHAVRERHREDARTDGGTRAVAVEEGSPGR